MDFFLFAIAHLFAVLSPGPTFIGLVSFAIGYGFKKSLPFAFGVLVGNVIFSVIAILGLSQFIFKNQILEQTFYLVSGIYIFYFGIKIFNKKVARRGIEINKNKVFMSGLIIELSNPKSIIFTTSLIALIIKPESTIILKTFVMFWLTFVSLIYETLIIYTFAKFRSKIFRYLPILNKVFSILLVIFALRLLFWAIKPFIF